MSQLFSNEKLFGHRTFENFKCTYNLFIFFSSNYTEKRPVRKTLMYEIRVNILN